MFYSVLHSLKPTQSALSFFRSLFLASLLLHLHLRYYRSCSGRARVQLAFLYKRGTTRSWSPQKPKPNKQTSFALTLLSSLLDHWYVRDKGGGGKFQNQSFKTMFFFSLWFLRHPQTNHLAIHTSTNTYSPTILYCNYYCNTQSELTQLGHQLVNTPSVFPFWISLCPLSVFCFVLLFDCIFVHRFTHNPDTNTHTKLQVNFK